ncbi:tripartite motif-containing protein 16-like [Brachyhypopomus gauderio]|uniref:tripartite motif-containing protein 16-like n=1 Tax=Brachyhypopomus gauderio TaxID=698409 RepID=UPI0040422CDD
MAEASISIDQNQFSCSICLDLLKDPVTMHCGHSFCKVCINGFWDQNEQKGVYSCPQCRETFVQRPVLRRNNIMSDVVEKLKKIDCSLSTELSPSFQGVQDVECDSCIGEKKRAVKSCLTCLASYCDTHVLPHHEAAAFRKHKLVKAARNLQDKLCLQHDKLLEVFCRTDQRGICYQCVMDEHKSHDVVSAQDESIEKKKLLTELQMKSKKKLENNEETLKELMKAVESFKYSAQAAVEVTERICKETINSIQKKCLQVTEMIRGQEKVEVSRAEGLLEKREQEIADLKRRLAEVEQLSLTEDHIPFLQSFQSLSAFLQTEEKPTGSINTQFAFDDIDKILSEIKDSLDDSFSTSLEKISNTHLISQITEVFSYSEVISEPEPTCREDFLQYICKLSLDPSTANEYLYLSEENSAVERKQKAQQYPDLPERFGYYCQVLCQEAVSRRSYFEVEWRGKDISSVAVSYKGIMRKGVSLLCKFGYNKQSWALQCTPDGCYFIHDNKRIFCWSGSHKIGVYVNHKAGTLSFYSVTDKMTLLHKVQTVFTEPLYPGFWLRPNCSIKLCSPI